MIITFIIAASRNKRAKLVQFLSESIFLLIKTPRPLFLFLSLPSFRSLICPLPQRLIIPFVNSHPSQPRFSLLVTFCPLKSLQPLCQFLSERHLFLFIGPFSTPIPIRFPLFVLSCVRERWAMCKALSLTEGERGN